MRCKYESTFMVNIPDCTWQDYLRGYEKLWLCKWESTKSQDRKRRDVPDAVGVEISWMSYLVSPSSAVTMEKKGLWLQGTRSFMERTHTHTIYPLDLKLKLQWKNISFYPTKHWSFIFLKALTIQNPSPKELTVNPSQSFSVLVVDFFWAVVALQMWRLPTQPPVQRSRPQGEPQDPTLRQRNPWLKSYNFLSDVFGSLNLWSSNVNDKCFETQGMDGNHKMFCNLMFSSPFRRFGEWGCKQLPV